MLCISFDRENRDANRSQYRGPLFLSHSEETPKKFYVSLPCLVEISRHRLIVIASRFLRLC
jgi:hypothetical protein